MTKLLSYTDKGTWIHRLSGSTKLIFFLLWCVTSAMTYDTRILLIMIAVTVILFALSKTEWRQISLPGMLDLRIKDDPDILSARTRGYARGAVLPV